MRNFLCVALSLLELGYYAVGIRLDSGNLAKLSLEARREMERLCEKYDRIVEEMRGIVFPEGCILHYVYSRFPPRPHAFPECLVVMASNDLNETKLRALQNKRHGLTAFGIGTELVTCRAQPALGCVFKLASLNGGARIKLSEEPGKSTVPGGKDVYRVFQRKADDSGDAFVADILVLVAEKDSLPVVGALFQYVAEATLRHADLLSLNVQNLVSTVVPSRVEPLLETVWAGPDGAGAAAAIYGTPEYLDSARKHLREEMRSLDMDRNTLELDAPGTVGLSLALTSLLIDLRRNPLGSASR